MSIWAPFLALTSTKIVPNPAIELHKEETVLNLKILHRNPSLDPRFRILFYVFRGSHPYFQGLDFCRLRILPIENILLCGVTLSTPCSVLS